MTQAGSSATASPPNLSLRRSRWQRGFRLGVLATAGMVALALAPAPADAAWYGGGWHGGYGGGYRGGWYGPRVGFTYGYPAYYGYPYYAPAYYYPPPPAYYVPAPVAYSYPPPPPPPRYAPAAAPATMPAPRALRVFFDFDKASLTAEGAKVVHAAADLYRRTGAARLDLTGYTDLAGSSPYNEQLSKHRAETVRQALVREGVPAQSVVESWRGKENPAVRTADGVREPRNRRVEILLP